MAVQQLLQSMQRLSLQSGAALLSTARLNSTKVSKCGYQWKVVDVLNIENNILSRSVHTSAVCMHKMDSRAYPPSKFPSSNGRWEPRKKISDMYEYTTDPIPIHRTGGRGPNGRIWNYRRSGGLKKNFFMIDWLRGGPKSGPPMVERVEDVFYDPNRTAHIALVAQGEKKRYIIATENMKPGDLISSSRVLSKTTVRANEGDSLPLGSLQVGTVVSSVEIYPDAGSLKARAAGCTAVLVRKLADRCVIRLPSKREMDVSAMCVATVGRVSNVDHNKRILGKAGRNRWLGIKPNSGKWHRKTGRFGRKIKPPRKPLVYTKPADPLNEKKHIYKYRISSSVV